jgi:hypothetical protein
MAKLVVFIPPPVEPGEAPMIIRKTEIRIPMLVKLTWLTGSNPAVLVVTD